MVAGTWWPCSQLSTTLYISIAYTAGVKPPLLQCSWSRFKNQEYSGQSRISSKGSVVVTEDRNDFITEAYKQLNSKVENGWRMFTTTPSMLQPKNLCVKWKSVEEAKTTDVKLLNICRLRKQDLETSTLFLYFYKVKESNSPFPKPRAFNVHYYKNFYQLFKLFSLT